jgi:hypothetical protein
MLSEYMPYTLKCTGLVMVWPIRLRYLEGAVARMVAAAEGNGSVFSAWGAFLRAMEVNWSVFAAILDPAFELRWPVFEPAFLHTLTPPRFFAAATACW